MGPVLRKRTAPAKYVEDDHVEEVKRIRKTKSKTVQTKKKTVKPKRSAPAQKKGNQSNENRPVEFLTAADVLLGRGKGSYLAQGNLRLQQLVGLNLPTYLEAADNKAKIEITNQIVAQIKQGGGRFLTEDSKRNLVEIPDRKARIKVGQAMRHRRRMMEEKRQAGGEYSYSAGEEQDEDSHHNESNTDSNSISTASHHGAEEVSAEEESIYEDMAQLEEPSLSTDDNSSHHLEASSSQAHEVKVAHPVESESTFLSFAKAALASLNVNHNVDAFIEDDDISAYTSPDYDNYQGPDDFGLEDAHNPLGEPDDDNQLFRDFQ